MEGGCRIQGGRKSSGWSRGVMIRVFEEPLFKIFAKHKTHENAAMFRKTFVSFARSNFFYFHVSQKL
jgi:hypothetical protein